MVVALSVVGCVHLYGQQSPSVLEFPEDDLGADPAVAADGTSGEVGDVEGESGGGIREIFDFLAEKGSKALNFGEGEDPGDAVDESEGKAIELKQLSNLNISNGRVGEAMRSINELISLKPYDPDVHFALGLCYRRLGRLDEAMKKYRDVLDLGGPKSLISLLMAEVHAVQGERTDALDRLREAAAEGRNVINDVGILPALREYRDDTEFIKLALQLENFQLDANLKHDPFTNPFPRAEDGEVATGKGDKSGPISLTPEEQDQLLKEAKKAYARVQFYVKLEDEAKAMRAYQQLSELLAQKDLVTIPKIVNDFRFLETRMEEVEVQIEGIRLKFYYNQAKEKLQVMKDHFMDGEYAGVETVHAEVVRLTEQMIGTSDQYQPVADRILEHASQWIRRARVRQEFSERKPRIQGIVIGESEKMAVVNDRVVRQGEAIQEFRVVKVESNRVTFRYKGEEIPLVFRRY